MADTLSLEGYRELVEQGLAGLELGADADDVAPLTAAMRYSLLAGGKRLRPVLCLATADVVGLEPGVVLPTALALELVHTFSLVHDDLPALDDDDLRRGRPTAHVQFGEDIAILAGDALLNGAFVLVSTQQAGPAERRLAAIAELARAVGPAGMIGGQYLDVTAPGDIGEAGLRRLDALKTGALIAASVGCALALAGADGETGAALRRYGALVGLLFQIVDDVLDATGTDEALGKHAGSDVRLGRQTMVTVLGLERARALVDETYAEALAALDAVPGRTDSLAAIAEQIARRDR
jgi:geranylgeranyl diphosphate synthase type II